MAVVNVNSVTINSKSGAQEHGPFSNNKSIISVDLEYVPWTNNSMSYAFYNCNKLTSVANINQNITSMSYTFSDCTNLVNAPIIPNSVTNMCGTFSSCKNLINFPVIPNNVTNMMDAFFRCHNLVNAPVIPNGVTDMTSAFYGCYNLVNAPVIPCSVLNLTQTFNGCTNLVTAPVIPNSVINITRSGWGLFQNCSNIQGNIYFHCLNITDATGTFSNTNALLQKNVFLPYNVQLGIYTKTYNAFNNAGYKPSEVRNGVYIKENPYFLNTNYFWWDSYYNIIYKYLGSNSDIVIPNSINGHNISLLDLILFNVPNTITSVDFSNVILSGSLSSKFAGYSLLQSVTNLNKNSSINSMSSAFSGCINLTTAPEIPNSVTTLYQAFQNCNSLVEPPEIPGSVTNMAFMFKYCQSLVNAPVIPNSVTDMIWAFEWCTSLANAPVIPNSVTSVVGTFNFCNSLTTAPEIPGSVTNMANTFYACKNMVGNVYIKSFNIANAYRCFYSTTNVKNVYIPFTYPNGVNSATYNSFITAGYKTDGSVCGVTLINYTDLYT